ncbi:hypothetical protein, partial [Mesorhizobium sp.]|uniref:hypothetical protein n=1 Tax=Mesorhizobium sp. TaxID=1871066 RepID=UPI0025BCA028
VIGWKRDVVIKKTPGRGCRYLGSGLRLRHTRGGEARPWTNCCWDCARAGSRLADDPEPKVSAAKIDSDFGMDHAQIKSATASFARPRGRAAL